MATPAIGRLDQVLRNMGQPVPGFTSATTWVDVVALTANTAANYDIPTGGSMLRLTPTAIPTYGNFNGTAAAPSGNVTNGSGSFPVGGQTYLVAPVGGEASGVLSLICAQACYVTIEVWS